MAEGWINALFADRWQAFSAGSQPTGYVHPLAIQVMGEVGIDLSGKRSKHMNEFLGQPFDRVITVCEPARDACPVFPGRAEQLHHTFEDPADTAGSDDAKLAVFRRVRDDIRAWLEDAFDEPTGAV